MYVEYEESSYAEASSRAPVHYDERPASSDPAVPDEDDDPDIDVEGHGADGGDEDETIEHAEAVDDRPQKKKRIIKSRQSLAEKRTGTTLFPLSRIKRIIKADQDLDMMSTEATFLIAVTTEYFIKHFMEEGYTKARLEKRRIVNYKDMAAVVARSEEFEFLRDVVPQPISISDALELRKQKLLADENPLHDEEPAPTSANTAFFDLPSASTGESFSTTTDVAAGVELPPLAISTNPLFPNAIVKRPANTHPRTSVSTPSKIGVGSATSPTIASTLIPTTAQLVTPTVKLTGKNAPSTPHSLTTRGSARRSIVPDETEDLSKQVINVHSDSEGMVIDE